MHQEFGLSRKRATEYRRFSDPSVNPPGVVYLGGIPLGFNEMTF